MVTILGPTASGKTTLGANLAARTNGEIISADSRQVYKRMDIGTGKDLADYTVDGKKIPYHLIDIVEPGTKYNVFEYQKDFLNAYHDIESRKKFPILCGGSGLYLESILRGYRLLPVPENKELREQLKNKTLSELTTLLSSYKQLHNKTDVDTPKRAIRAIEIEQYYKQTPVEKREFPLIKSLTIGIDVSRDIRRERISQRLRARLEEGMVEEIQSLLESGISAEDLIYYGLEYKFVTQYIIGELTYNEMVHGLETAIHQFAKRQMTWFRGMERRGIPIVWLSGDNGLEKNMEEIQILLGN